MCWTLRTTSGGNPIGITGLAVMSRCGWRTWARGVRPVGISTTSCETSPTTRCALAAASASLRAGATGHRPRGRHEDASRLPGCRRRARQAVVLEGIGAAFEQAGPRSPPMTRSPSTKGRGHGVRRSSSHRPRRRTYLATARASPARDRTITLVKQIGRHRWKKVSGYHRQGPGGEHVLPLQVHHRRWPSRPESSRAGE